MLTDIFQRWPDQLSINNLGRPVRDWSLNDIAVAIRTGSRPPIKIEGAILARQAISQEHWEECQILRCCLYFFGCDRSAFSAALESLRAVNPSRLEIRILTLVFWLQTDNVQALSSAPSDLWRDEDSVPLLRLCRISFLLKCNELHKAQQLFDDIRIHTLESCLLEASMCSKLGNHAKAIEIVLPLLARAPKCLRLYRQAIMHLIDGRDGENILPVLNSAIEIFGENPELLHHITTVNLYRRQPGLARRSALLTQISSSVQVTPINQGNHITSYEMNGSPDWLEHLLPAVTSDSGSLDLLVQSNLCMQLASIESRLYPGHVSSLLQKMRDINPVEPMRLPTAAVNKKCRDSSKKLRIAWITPDLAYHPVSRFLFGFFSSSINNLRHSHTVVSLFDHLKESSFRAFESLSKIDMLDVSSFEALEVIKKLRGNEFDVAIDLSGWTGGNFAQAFLSRIAPVQVNYLGYFASSGIKSMDYWLGDANLFPRSHSEWASESLWRLQRPFLAWSPHRPLPEADVSVSEAPSGPIRFGSFNHNRKLSDATLRLWAELMDAVPCSRLVLKASAQSDSETQRLLRRRMLRQGLDPERVDWLALTQGPVEHMQQYSQIDIALDPIPNGGCTTTCEALWMGVPTVTLAGSSYVSRMSTAVLAGANMPEWIAQDRLRYIELASEQAARVNELRTNRDHWRTNLQHSPLGDASDLMHHLEDAFDRMNAATLSSE